MLTCPKPAIIGTNTRDGYTAQYNPVNGTNATIGNQAFMTTFFCPTQSTIKDRIGAGIETFQYSYNGNFTNVSPRWWMGAYHSGS
jgi:hypothetical protein